MPRTVECTFRSIAQLTVSSCACPDSLESKAGRRAALPAPSSRSFGAPPDNLQACAAGSPKGRDAFLATLAEHAKQFVLEVACHPNSKPIIDAGTALNKNLTSIEEALYQTKNQSSQDPLNFPIRLNNKLAALLGVVSRSETPPNERLSRSMMSCPPKSTRNFRSCRRS